LIVQLGLLTLTEITLFNNPNLRKIVSYTVGVYTTEYEVLVHMCTQINLQRVFQCLLSPRKHVAFLDLENSRL